MKKKANGNSEMTGYDVKQKIGEVAGLVQQKQLDPLQCNAIIGAFKTLLLVERERRQTLQWARKRPPVDMVRFAEGKKR